MSNTNWTPLPHVGFKDALADNALPPVQLAISGEMNVATSGSAYNMGAARVAGVISKVWMSVAASGKDDSSDLCISGEVYINGTTCLANAASIAHISGEASQQKTTVVSGEGTGIVQAVIDYDANTFEAGDVLTCDIVVVRTASPTTEIDSPVVVVEMNHPALPV